MNIEFELRENLIILKLNQPEKLNPLSSSVLEKISEVIESYQNDPKPLLLTGEGRVFSAGIDLSEIASSNTPEEAQKPFRALKRVLLALLNYPAPTITFLNGPAIAGGGELALATDFILASPSSRLEWPEIRWNIAAPLLTGLAARSAIPKLAAFSFTGDGLSAEEALSMGVVYKIVENMDEAIKVAESIASLWSRNKEAYTVISKHVRKWKIEAVETIADKLVQLAGSMELIERARKFLKK